LNRGLIKFDLASIPANARIDSAKLYLTVTSDHSDHTRTLRVYRLKQDWAEEQASWNVYASGHNWASAGASGAGDIDSSETGSVSVLTGQRPGM